MQLPTRGSLLGHLAGVLALITMTALTLPAYSATPLKGNARLAIDRFLLSQTAGLPGKVIVTVDRPLSGDLPSCDAPEPFLPNGAHLWGRVSVGVRCNSNLPWTRYVSAYVAVLGTYYVAARPIDAGQALTPADGEAREGDLASLPRSVIVDPAQLNGMLAENRIASGAPIRRELLRGVPIVQQGQIIKVISQGPGFIVSTEGKAMTNAAVGAIVQVKIQGGQVLSGIVRSSGVVERSN